MERTREGGIVVCEEGSWVSGHALESVHKLHAHGKLSSWCSCEVDAIVVGSSDEDEREEGLLSTTQADSAGETALLLIGLAELQVNRQCHSVNPARRPRSTRLLDLRLERLSRSHRTDRLYGSLKALCSVGCHSNGAEADQRDEGGPRLAVGGFDVLLALLKTAAAGLGSLFSLCTYRHRCPS